MIYKVIIMQFSVNFDCLDKHWQHRRFLRKTLNLAKKIASISEYYPYNRWYIYTDSI